jgi:hypothetical protein
MWKGRRVRKNRGSQRGRALEKEGEKVKDEGKKRKGK